MPHAPRSSRAGHKAANNDTLVRKPLAAFLSLAGGLVLAGTAAAGSGFEPQPPKTPGAEDITDIYYFVAFFAAVVFLLVLVPLVLFVVRYRNRGHDQEREGPQIRGNTRLELAWTAVPVLIVAAIMAFVLIKAPGINSEPAQAGDALQIRVEGRRFYWRYVYPNGAVAIDRLRVPVDRPVNLEITAPDSDVIHSYWIPELGGKFDAVPGDTNDFSFRATEVGVFPGNCGEFCGVQHAAMTAEAEVMPTETFDGWLAREGQTQARGDSDLGEALWKGVCLKCHRLQGETYIGPNLGANTLLRQPKALEDIVEKGQGAMPPVGQGWSEREMKALTDYTRTLVSEGGGDGS